VVQRGFLIIGMDFLAEGQGISMAAWTEDGRKEFLA
jgi:hypothetical protein